MVGVLVGCGDGSISAPDVVARVGGREVRYAEFELYLKENAVGSETVLGSDVLSALFDQFLEEELLRRLAIGRDLAAEDVSRRFAVQRLLAEQPGEEVTRQRIEAHYLENFEEYQAPERVKLRQLLVEDPLQAEEARSEWLAGSSYEEVVDKYSADRAAHRASEGELAREDLPPDFAETIFELEVGEISEIVPAEYGYHIFQVIRRLPATVIPLEETEAVIRRDLSRDLADRELEDLLQRARESYPVRVFDRNIPFNYAGRY
jgi:parvulin-like peptidyl-prolyl isomerase